MHRASHNVPLVAVPLLVAVAGFGYLAGNYRVVQSSAAAFGGQTQYATIANAQFEYPSSWRQSAAVGAVAGALPGLPISGEVVLAPGGDPSQAGLIAGELPGREPSPLPARFVSTLSALPHTEVLNAPGGQAYRYTRLSIPGYSMTLELFAIPGQATANTTVLACYATASAAAELPQCAQIVSKFSLLGPTEYDLTPDAGYARTLTAVLGLLERERRVMRGQLAHEPTPKAASVLASSLAERFSTAAGALHEVEAPAIAVTAATTFTAAALRARDAYLGLAAAVRQESNPRYETALGEIQKAEAGVDRALESFALLGYGFS